MLGDPGVVPMQTVRETLLVRQRAVITALVLLGVLASLALGAAAVDGLADAGFVDGLFGGVEATHDNAYECDEFQAPGGGGGSGGC